MRSSVLPIVFGACRTAASTAATSSRGISPRSPFSAERDAPVGGLVGQPAGADDRVVEPAGPQVVVGLALGAQVDGERVVAGSVGVRPHAADHHVAVGAGGLGGVDQLHRAAVVHRHLALRPASRAGAGREHDRFGVPDRGGDLLVGGVLEVADDGLGAGRLDVTGVVGIADQRADFVPALGEQAGECQGDLAVTSGDGDAHRPSVRGAVSARTSGSGGRPSPGTR